MFLSISNSMIHCDQFTAFKGLIHLDSSCSHYLSWLHDDPEEKTVENMEKTIALIDRLCVLVSEDSDVIHKQTHRHIFICYKKNKPKCRFGIPLWTMRETRILIPMHKTDIAGDQIHFKGTRRTQNDLSVISNNDLE